MEHEIANAAWMMAAWVLANVLTGISYFLIPAELMHWTRGLDHPGLKWLSVLFLSFIAFCGLHHIVMAFYVHSHPITPILVGVDAAMASVSMGVAWVLAKNRSGIRTALHRAINTAPKTEKNQ